MRAGHNKLLGVELGKCLVVTREQRTVPGTTAQPTVNRLEPEKGDPAEIHQEVPEIHVLISLGLSRNQQQPQLRH